MNFISSYKKIKKKLILAEVFLLLSSVFIFRGLWELLDRYPVMHSLLALRLSVIVGIVVTIFCLRYILKYSK